MSMPTINHIVQIEPVIDVAYAYTPADRASYYYFATDGTIGKLVTNLTSYTGLDARYKKIQTAVSGATAGSATDQLTFVSAISQNTQGVISATSNSVRFADNSQSGIVPATTKDKFLHANASTGALEWVGDNNQTVESNGHAFGANDAVNFVNGTDISLAYSGTTITISHNVSGANGSYGLSADATPAAGSSFNVPYLTVDAQGHVTSAATHTVTLPAALVDADEKTSSSNTTDKTYLVGAKLQSTTGVPTYSYSNIWGQSGRLNADMFSVTSGGLKIKTTNHTITFTENQVLALAEMMGAAID